MKIALTVEVLEKEFYSGIEQYAYNLARQLIELNLVDLTLIASRDFPQSLFGLWIDSLLSVAEQRRIW